MKEREEPRPYWVPPKKSIALQVISVIVKPLHVDENGATYELVVTQPAKSSASKQIIDKRGGD